MATVTLTQENFEQTVSGNDIVLVDFWATWCGPCRQFGPVFEEASEKYPDIVFGKVSKIVPCISILSSFAINSSRVKLLRLSVVHILGL